MSYNQLYQYQDINYNNLNNNNNNSNINQFDLHNRNYIIRQTMSFERTIINSNDLHNFKNNNQYKQNTNQQKNNNQSKRNTNQQKNNNQYKRNTNQQKNKINFKKSYIKIISPKNENNKYILTSTIPNNKPITIFKYVFTEYYEQIVELCNRINLNMNRGNIKSFNLYWKYMYDKFTVIYNEYYKNKLYLDQTFMITSIVELNDRLTLLIKQK